MLNAPNLKVVLNFLFSAIESSVDLDANKDGKISLQEIILGMGPSVLGSGPFIQALPLAGGEWLIVKNDPEQLTALNDWIQEDFDLPTRLDNVEELVEDALTLLLQIWNFISKHILRRNGEEIEPVNTIDVAHEDVTDQDGEGPADKSQFD